MNETTGFFFSIPLNSLAERKQRLRGEERKEKRVTKGWQSHREVLNKPSLGLTTPHHDCVVLAASFATIPRYW